MAGFPGLKEPLRDEVEYFAPLHLGVLPVQILLYRAQDALPAAAADDWGRGAPWHQVPGPLDDGLCVGL